SGLAFGSCAARVGATAHATSSNSVLDRLLIPFFLVGPSSGGGRLARAAALGAVPAVEFPEHRFRWVALLDFVAVHGAVDGLATDPQQARGLRDDPAGIRESLQQRR